MIQSFPLLLEGVQFRHHDIVSICPLDDKVAVIHFAFGSVTQEEYDRERRTPSYALLDTFSLDFSEKQQAYLSYYEQEVFSTHDAVCFWENSTYLLNTKRYKGFSQSIARIIQVSDTSLVDVGEAPPPIQETYNDQKIYAFGEKEVSMSSPFVMVCRENTSNKLLWKLKLSAYLYTQVEEENGILYFGTAGKGGRFYGVHAVDGKVLFDYNTGGTVNFTRYNGHILLADRKEKPVLLNPQNGVEVRKIPFGNFRFTVHQQMLVLQDKLYAIASGKDAMYAVCVDLMDQE